MNLDGIISQELRLWIFVIAILGLAYIYYKERKKQEKEFYIKKKKAK